MRRSALPSRALVAALAWLAIGNDVAAAQSIESPSASIQAADDPAAAVAEASRRFGLPEHWVRSVMHVESGGNARAVSRAGAIGLMQVMPATYAEMRARHRLGADPFDVRDNVLAGTAYLGAMFDRYGAPGFLGAYNAGPGRWVEHLEDGRPLPAETIGYLARLGPMLNLAGLPNTSEAVGLAAPSPFSAPIFVAWSGDLRAAESPSERRRLRPMMAANSSLAPATGGLFMQREPAPAASLTVQWDSNAPPADISANPPMQSVDPPSDHLFVPRPNSTDAP